MGVHDGDISGDWYGHTPGTGGTAMDAEGDIEPECDLRVDMFPFLLQAVYNTYKLLDLEDSGEDWRLDGDHVEALYLETRFLVRFFRRFGVDPMYPVDEGEDGRMHMRHLSLQMLHDVMDDASVSLGVPTQSMRELKSENDSLRQRLLTSESRAGARSAECGELREKLSDLKKENSILSRRMYKLLQAADSCSRSMKAEILAGIRTLEGMSKSDDTDKQACDAASALKSFGNAYSCAWRLRKDVESMLDALPRACDSGILTCAESTTTADTPSTTNKEGLLQ